MELRAGVYFALGDRVFIFGRRAAARDVQPTAVCTCLVMNPARVGNWERVSPRGTDNELARPRRTLVLSLSLP